MMAKTKINPWLYVILVVIGLFGFCCFGSVAIELLFPSPTQPEPNNQQNTTSMPDATAREEQPVKPDVTDPPPPPLKASQTMQDTRAELISKFISEGIFQKIDKPGTVPRVYVLPRFYTLTFDDKELFVSVCYAYWYEIPKGGEPRIGDYLWIYDARTNKKVGSFGDLGLSLD